MSQVKLKLTDDFNNFLGLMLVAYWQLDMRYIYTPNCNSVVIQLNQLKGTEIKNGNTNRNKLGFTIFLRHVHCNQVQMRYVLTTGMIKMAEKRYPHVYNN